MRTRTVVVLAVLAAAVAGPVTIPSSRDRSVAADATDLQRSEASAPCDGPGAHPWVTGLRDRVIAFNQMATYAIERHGAPVSCEGAVTAEFDGAQFGTLGLRFAGGMTLTVETMPPEAQIIILRSNSGFDDEVTARSVLESYAESFGLSVDWTTPTEETTEDSERVQSFWDPTAGLNGSASLVVAGGTLVALRFSAAL